MQADFDHTLFEQGNNSGDANLLVKFFNKPLKDSTASIEAGRPIFKETCYVSIAVAGKRDPLAVRPATIADKARFPRHFQAFEARVEMPVEGTPLVEWPLISRSQAEELTYLNVKTVEQLATMADGNVQKFLGGFALKQKAKDWLEIAANKAGDLKFKELAEKTEEENKELKAQLATVMERLNSLEAVETVDKAAPRRRRTKED